MATLTEAPVEPRIATLTAADRCDACGARAYYKAGLASGLDLLFCRHHGVKHHEAMKDKGSLRYWVDETFQLDEAVKPSREV